MAGDQKLLAAPEGLHGEVLSPRSYGGPLICLLGTPHIDHAYGSPEAFQNKKLAALLTYLAVEQRAFSRAHLARFFWPDNGDENALRSLRMALVNLRQRVPNGIDLLDVSRTSVQMNLRARNRMDLNLFLAGLPVSGKRPPVTVMEHALRQYRGELLEGLELPECDEFQEWLQWRREEFHRNAVHIVRTLAELYAKAPGSHSAMYYINRWIALAPWDDNAHELLMRNYAMQGDVSSSLTHFHQYKAGLMAQLGVPPSQHLTLFEQQLRHGAYTLLSPAKTSTLPRMAEHRFVAVMRIELRCLGLLVEQAALALQGAREQVKQSLQTMGATVVNGPVGSEVLAYFGYPFAHERSVHEAIETGLKILQCQLPTRVTQRLVLHCGPVIASDALADMTGVTSSVTQRMLSLAIDQTLIVTEAVRQQVRDATWHFRPSGILPMDDDVLDIYSVSHGAQGRVQSKSVTTAFQGRIEELQTLHAVWQQRAQPGQRMIMLEGAAGVGKSRLLHEFCRQIAGDHPLVLTSFIRTERLKGPTNPAFEFAQSVAKCLDIDEWEVKQARFEQSMQEAGVAEPQRQIVREIFRRLGSGAALEEVMNPPGAMAAWLNTCQQLFNWRALENPILILLEDFHQVNDMGMQIVRSTLALRNQLKNGLILGTCRTGFKYDLEPDSVAVIRLEALDEQESMALLAVLNDQQSITDDALVDVLEAAEGNPLALEELYRSVLATGQCVPTERLRATMLSRLDRMGSVFRYVACAVAVAEHHTSRQGLVSLLEAEVDPVACEHAIQALMDMEWLDVNPNTQDIYYRWPLMKTIMAELLTEDSRKRIGQAGQTDTLQDNKL